MLGAGTCLAVEYYVPLQQLFTSTWDLLLLMAYFMSLRLKEGLTCMEESDPFAFEKKPWHFSDLRWRPYAVSAWSTSLAQVCTRCPYLYLLMDFIALVSCGSGRVFFCFVLFFSIFLACSLSMKVINTHRMSTRMDLCRHEMGRDCLLLSLSPLIFSFQKNCSKRKDQVGVQVELHKYKPLSQ